MKRADAYADRLSGLLAAGGILAVGAMIAAVLTAAAIVNGISLRWEEDQLRHGVQSRIEELQASVVPQANWDDAVANLDTRFDLKWAEANIGAYLTETAEFERVYVMDRAGRWIFARHAGPATRANADAQMEAAAAPLVATVRAAEAARGPFRIQGPSPSMISKPIQASSTVSVDGQAWVLTATLVQPDFGKALPGRVAPVVLTARRIDEGFVAELAERYQLAAAHPAPVGSQTGAAVRGVARAAFLDRAGRPVAEMVWSPRRPGAALLRVVALPLALAVALLAGVILLLRRSVMRSLTDLIRTEDDLRDAARRAEASDNAKSEFLANMSHEIRTPLNGVIGLAELLGRSKLDAEQANLVDTIRTSGRTLDRLLMDVLDLSKIDAGRLSICREPFNLYDELKSLAGLWGPQAAARGLTLTCEIEPARAVVLGDAVRLRQILTNLLGNAVKFTERGGVTLSVARDGDRFVFTVADTGIGFDEAARARLFGRFEQADTSITRRFGGTGLGLAISRNLAVLMDGTLECESAPGQGSAFVVTLALPAAAAVCAGSPSAQPLALDRGLRVLAADDHAINRKVVKLILDQLDCDVSLASDGLEAVELFRTSDYDLVLMDMRMPNLDGLAAIREIRTLEAAGGRPRTPILMLTANAGEDYGAMAQAAGADGHVTKPLKPETLMQAIRAVAPLRAAA